MIDFVIYLVLYLSRKYLLEIAMTKYAILSTPHPNPIPIIKLIKYIELIHLLGDVTDEEVDVVLGDVKA